MICMYLLFCHFDNYFLCALHIGDAFQHLIYGCGNGINLAIAKFH